MKALSLTQPWAWIVLHLKKRIENRSRNLGHYRGPLLLHASKGVTVDDWWSAYDFVASRFGEADAARIPPIAHLVRGKVVGVCEVVDQIAPEDAHGYARAHAGWSEFDQPGELFPPGQEPWYMGAHAYVLDNVRELPEPVPCKGALGLWTPPVDAIGRVKWQLCAFRDDHDPVTAAPRGNECGAIAVAILHWRDGRKSPMCERHGVKALTPAARELVASVEPLSEVRIG